METLQYPVVAFSRAALIEVCKDENELTHCNASALRNGYFEGLKIVDSNGRLTAVRGVRKIGTVGPLWGFNLFRGRQIRVALSFGTQENIELDDLKAMVLEVFKANKNHWNSGGNLEEVEREILSSDSAESVIKILNVMFREYT